MINGHGDDLYRYEHIRSNFSSNVYNHVDHTGLNVHLAAHLSSIRSYPEPEPYTLERTIARNWGIGEDEVCVTNGATEAIYLIAQSTRGSRSLILSPTFSEYEDACRLHGHEVENIFSLEKLPSSPALVWLCNPNNPTGEIREANWLKSVVEANPQHLFIIDQSYEMFADRPTLPVTEMVRRENVILLHSMTKCFAVPGIRLGYITACPKLIDQVRAQRMPWSVNALAIEAGLYLLAHAEEYRPEVERLILERRRVESELLKTGGVDITPSNTHYMLLHLHRGSAAELKEFLARERGLLIRDASNFAGLDAGCFRVAIQTPRENDLLIEGVRTWISKH